MSAPPPPERDLPRIPLAPVVKACPDILPYCDDDLREWRDPVTAAAFVRGTKGISPSAWEEAKNLMGSAAAITVACILRRVTEISSPDRYLRALAAKPALEAVSPGPMLMALLKGTNRVAARVDSCQPGRLGFLRGPVCMMLVPFLTQPCAPMAYMLFAGQAGDPSAAQSSARE